MFTMIASTATPCGDVKTPEVGGHVRVPPDSVSSHGVYGFSVAVATAAHHLVPGIGI